MIGFIVRFEQIKRIIFQFLNAWLFENIPKTQKVEKKNHYLVCKNV